MKSKTHKAIVYALCYGAGKRKLARKYGWRKVKVAYKEFNEPAGDLDYALC